jgi:hypothetical protein
MDFDRQGAIGRHDRPDLFRHSGAERGFHISLFFIWRGRATLGRAWS